MHMYGLHPQHKIPKNTKPSSHDRVSKMLGPHDALVCEGVYIYIYINGCMLFKDVGATCKPSHGPSSSRSVALVSASRCLATVACASHVHSLRSLVFTPKNNSLKGADSRAWQRCHHSPSHPKRNYVDLGRDGPQLRFTLLMLFCLRMNG